jgi:glycosyltransferase involved in cell wall biosynthesis
MAAMQPLRTTVTVLGMVPPRVRSAVLTPPDGLARRRLRRPGPHPTAITIHLLAVHAEGGLAALRSETTRLAAGTDPVDGARLARMALAVGDPGLADTVLAGITSDADSPSMTTLRAEVDFRMGRYAGALARLGTSGSSPWGDYLRRRATEELAVLEPAWRPVVGAPTPLRDPVPGRVLHLLTNSLPYRQAGYTVRSQSVARSQIAAGLDPQMVTRAGFPTTSGVSGARATDLVEGVPYHRLRLDLDPTAGPAEVATETARAAVPLITSLRPALLQPTTNHLNAQVALALGARYGLPVVYEVRGFLEETWTSRVGTAAMDGDRYGAARTVETACMRAVDAIVTLSDTMRSDIIGRGGIAPEAVVVIPNAVDIERFVPGPRDAALAASLGIAADETVVGYISTFTAYEGIEHLIRATAILVSRGHRVRLLLVGDGEARSTLEATVKEAGLDEGVVIFTGRVPYADIARYYRTIDIFVVPRTADRVSQLVTPLKPFEAMAMEKAVVVSAVDALLEIIEEGVTGRSFLAEDPASLADTLEPLLDDAGARAALGRAARAWVAQHRTWRQNGLRYLELYRRLGVA